MQINPQHLEVRMTHGTRFRPKVFPTLEKPVGLAPIRTELTDQTQSKDRNRFADRDCCFFLKKPPARSEARHDSLTSKTLLRQP